MFKLIYGITPLMNAIIQGNLEIIRELIKAGADLDVQDNLRNNSFNVCRK